MRVGESRSLKPLAWAAFSFTALAITATALAVFGVVTFQMGLLILIGLVGIHLGAGVLVLVYRFVATLR